MRAKEGTKKIQNVPTVNEKPSDHPFCGMWKAREDTKDPAAYIRKIRQPRYYWDDVLGDVRSDPPNT